MCYSDLIRKANGAYVEVDFDYYDGCLNALPPAAMNAHGFILGEPYSNNRQGVATWLCFIRKPSGDDYRYFCRIATVADWRNDCADLGLIAA